MTAVTAPPAGLVVLAMDAVESIARCRVEPELSLV